MQVNVGWNAYLISLQTLSQASSGSEIQLHLVSARSPDFKTRQAFVLISVYTLNCPCLIGSTRFLGTPGKGKTRAGRERPLATLGGVTRRVASFLGGFATALDLGRPAATSKQAGGPRLEYYTLPLYIEIDPGAMLKHLLYMTSL